MIDSPPEGALVKTVALLLVLFACAFATASAEDPMQDVLYLTNGSVIRGSILELTPGENVKIRTADGSIFVFDMGEVERMAKEPIPPSVRFREQESPQRRSPGVAFGLSFLFPGLGQYYNGQPAKAVIQEVVYVGGLVLAFGAGVETDTKGSNPISAVEVTETNDAYTAGLVLALGSWLWSMVDAPLQAGKINEQAERERFGHMLEFGGPRYSLGLDPIAGDGVVGARATLHF